MGKELLLVGSIPFDTAEEVFRSFGAKLGPYLPAIPDGEVGPRRHWITRVHYQVFAGHPELEAIRRPAPENGVERQFPRGPNDGWQFRVREGVEQVRFGDPGWRLGFARDALNSYFVFKTLREKGVLPEGLRFQVSMPMVNSVLPPRVIPDAGDREKIKPGYREALRAELATILDKIPHEDLAIQWDASSELQDVYGMIPDVPDEGLAGAVARNIGQVRALSPRIPDAVMLGYHLCFGTLGGWPRFQPDDLAGTVALANAFVEASGRRVDWLHIPVLDRADDAFFAPLADLEPQGARIYLGAIHNMAGYEARIAAARKHLPEFGVAAYCGFGRIPPSELPAILDEHVRAVGAG